MLHILLLCGLIHAHGFWTVQGLRPGNGKTLGGQEAKLRPGGQKMWKPLNFFLKKFKNIIFIYF